MAVVENEETTNEIYTGEVVGSVRLYKRQAKAGGGAMAGGAKSD